MNEIKFPFLLGDIVNFTTTRVDFGVSEITIKKGQEISIFKSGQPLMSPPAMVITEVVKEDIKNTPIYDEFTGKPLRSRFKVNCQWFAQNINAYMERWFNPNVLIEFKYEKQPFQEWKINDLVVLRTAVAANHYTESTISHTLADNKKDDKLVNDVKVTITRTYNTQNYFPPKMVVIGIEKNKEQQPKFDKVTGLQKRECSELRVKCMWYDYKTGKYSEHYFTPEALIKADDLKDMPLPFSDMNAFSDLMTN